MTVVSFIVPVYNEAATVEELLQRVFALAHLHKQVIVVDDGSTDGTTEKLRALCQRLDFLLVQQPNGGKGSAVRAAIPHLNGTITVIQDADLEYDPADVPTLVAPVDEGAADVVFGTRFSRASRCSIVAPSRLGNRALSALTNRLFGLTLSDMETGAKAFRTEVLRALDLQRDDFGIEPEIAAKARHYRIVERPVSYRPRTRSQGKKLRWHDGLRAVSVLVRIRVSESRSGRCQCSSTGSRALPSTSSVTSLNRT